jgi:hypothetical protein
MATRLEMLAGRWKINSDMKGTSYLQWIPNLNRQDAMPLEPLAAYSLNLYMYIIMGWV